jgi:branched-chain amino acid transport system ATP-binding protein
MTVHLEVDRLTKRFGGLTAVRDLSFTVEEGVIAGLIGPNGAGKTTVFNLVSGQTQPTDGEIRLRGRSLSGIPPHRRVRLGMVRTFQATVLYADATVRENVLRGLAACSRAGLWGSIPGMPAHAAWEGELERRAQELLELVELAAVSDEQARNLAYGHQRALGVAVALATSPELLMLDEPVAGMNPAETGDMARIIRKVNHAGTTILVVEHDMGFVMGLCSHIVVVSNGQKIAEGPPDEIRRDPAVIAAYLGAEHDDAA